MILLASTPWILKLIAYKKSNNLEKLFVQNDIGCLYPKPLLNKRRKEFLTIQLFCKYCHFAETLGL